MSILHASILVVVVLCAGLSRPDHGSDCFCEAAPQHGTGWSSYHGCHNTKQATRFYATAAWRGGASRTKEEETSGGSSSSSGSTEAYTLLARAVQSRLNQAEEDSDGSSAATQTRSPQPNIASIVNAFRSLSSAQKAFKGLDGAAHEAYQRTHRTGGSGGGGDDSVLSVQGRARRSAARTSAVAHALGACELCELIRSPAVFDEDSLNANNNTSSTVNGTVLEGRQVLLNVTEVARLGKDSSKNNSIVSVLVLYEPAYQGGAGIHHGSIEDLAAAEEDAGTEQHNPSRRRRGGGQRTQGRLLIVIGDRLSEHLDDKLFRILEQKPKHVRLHSGPEVASVQPCLYQAAGYVLTTVEPILRSHNTSAVHFVGRSLSGGIAALAANMLDGEIPLPADQKTSKSKRPRKRKRQPSPTKTETDSIVQNDVLTSAADMSNKTTIPLRPLQGLGRGRTSALSLGSPPCLSANVPADFVTSILYGDDIICRASPESLERFFKRTRRALKRGGNILGKRLNWMADTMTLATSNLQSHAVGSEGEEARLSIAGRAYLVRPRRLGGLCSMHEVGSQLKGGREALRAAVLWQLNDILLSRSLWKHHQLESYIHGIDRVQLRGLDDHSNNSNTPLDEGEDAA